MSDTSDLSNTIVPNSNQLNADDLMIGPITVKITDVTRGSKDQPISIKIPPHQPFLPGKSMRRVLISIWGKNGKDWVGKSLTLYCDPAVKFGGVAVGGIRISNASHIDQAQTMMLTTTRSKRAPFTVKPLEPQKEETPPTISPELHKAAMEAAGGGSDAFKEWFLGISAEDKAALRTDMDKYQKTAEKND